MTNQRYRVVCLLNALEDRLHALRADQAISDQALWQVFDADSQAVLRVATPQDMRYVRDRLNYMIEELHLPASRPSLAA